MNGGIIQYSQVSTFIIESWPVAVEWFITSKEYKERGIPDYGGPFYQVGASYPIDRGHQDWKRDTPGYNNDYSPVFIDLVDNFDQFDYYPGSPDDIITGYTLAGIESTFLKHVYGRSSLTRELSNNWPSGASPMFPRLVVRFMAQY